MTIVDYRYIIDWPQALDKFGEAFASPSDDALKALISSFPNSGRARNEVGQQNWQGVPEYYTRMEYYPFTLSLAHYLLTFTTLHPEVPREPSIPVSPDTLRELGIADFADGDPQEDFERAFEKKTQIFKRLLEIEPSLFSEQYYLSNSGSFCPNPIAHFFEQFYILLKGFGMPDANASLNLPLDGFIPLFEVLMKFSPSFDERSLFVIQEISNSGKVIGSYGDIKNRDAELLDLEPNFEQLVYHMGGDSIATAYRHIVKQRHGD